MNQITPEIDAAPTRDEAETALARLRQWAESATPEEVATLDPAISRLLPGAPLSNYPALARAYPDEFQVDDA